MKKKILIISYLAYPLFKENTGIIHGGAQLALANIAKHMDKDHYEIHFIVGDFDQPKTERLKDGITLYRGQKIRDVGFFGAMSNFFRLFFLIAKIRPHAIISSSAGWLTIELIFIKGLIGSKYIFRSSHRNNICGNTDTKSYGWLYRKLINHIDCFVLQNEEDKKILEACYGYERKKIFIRNSQSIPEICPTYDQREYILWVSRSEQVKRPDLFLELARKLPDQNFVMIMPRTNEKIFLKIKKIGSLIENLKIIDGVERKKIDNYFQKAKYYVNTSEGEGFPNTIVEAMKYGTPVISFFLDYDRIFKDNGIGLAAQGDLEKVLNFIENTSREKWDELSSNCRKFAKDNFDIKNNIKKWEALIDSMI